MTTKGHRGRQTGKVLLSWNTYWGSSSAIFLKNYFLAMLGLHCFVGFSLVVASRGYSPVAVREFLLAVASLVEEHRL